MRTVCGLGRLGQRLIGRDRSGAVPIAVAEIRPLSGNRRLLVTDRLGDQRRGGARLDQVDGTTCGSAVLVALAAWADPAETLRLEGELSDDQVAGGAGVQPAAGLTIGFGARFDARQQQVHRESTRFWPQALGTSPWGMVAWLRRHAPGAGPYRVRLVDDASPADLADAIDRTAAALAAGRPVPLLIGGFVPRHYVLALAVTDAGWHVYEPGSGQVRLITPGQLRDRAIAPVLGFDRLARGAAAGVTTRRSRSGPERRLVRVTDTLPSRSVDLPAQWTPGDVEAGMYERWVEAGYFTADVTSDKPAY